MKHVFSICCDILPPQGWPTETEGGDANGVIDTAKRGVPFPDFMQRQGYNGKKSGRDWVYCCPLHGDVNPSFRVYADGHYYCFGCGAHGDVVDLYSRMTNKRMGEAARELCDMYGLHGRDESLPPGARAVIRPFSQEERRKEALLDYLDRAGDNLAKTMEEYRRDAADLIELRKKELDALLQQRVSSYHSQLEAANDPEVEAYMLEIGKCMTEIETLRALPAHDLLKLVIQGAAPWKDGLPLLGSVS